MANSAIFHNTLLNIIASPDVVSKSRPASSSACAKNPPRSLFSKSVLSK